MHAHGVTHADRGSADGAVVRVVGEPHDEGAVDLHGRDLEALEVGERRVPRSEVVDDRRDPHGGERKERALHRVDVVDERALRQLDLEPLPRQAALSERGANVRHDVRAPQVRCRHIDTHAHRASRRVVPGPRVPARAPHDEAVDLHDEAGLLRDGDELHGRDVATIRQRPTYQRFEGLDAAVRQAHERLVVHGQHTVGQRGP